MKYFVILPICIIVIIFNNEKCYSQNGPHEGNTLLASSSMQQGILEGLVGGLEELSRQMEQRNREKILIEQQKELMRHQQELENKKREAENNEIEKIENSINTGTGFYINSNGFITTNYHVIKNKSYISAKDFNGNFYKATIVNIDHNNDLAILKINVKSNPVAIINSNLIQKGQRVLAIGYPQISIQGNESKVTDGIVNSQSGPNNNKNWFQISAPIQGGNSGGPLVNQKGYLIGVIVASLDEKRFFSATGSMPQNVNYAIKSNLLVKFLSDNNVEYISHYKNNINTVDYVDKSTLMIVASNKDLDIDYNDNFASEKDKNQNEIKNNDVVTNFNKRDLEVAKAYPDWQNLKNDPGFLSWLNDQPSSVKKIIDSTSCKDIINLVGNYKDQVNKRIKEIGRISSVYEKYNYFVFSSLNNYSLKENSSVVIVIDKNRHLATIEKNKENLYSATIEKNISQLKINDPVYIYE